MTVSIYKIILTTLHVKKSHLEAGKQNRKEGALCIISYSARSLYASVKSVMRCRRSKGLLSGQFLSSLA